MTATSKSLLLLSMLMTPALQDAAAQSRSAPRPESAERAPRGERSAPARRVPAVTRMKEDLRTVDQLLRSLETPDPSRRVRNLPRGERAPAGAGEAPAEVEVAVDANRIASIRSRIARLRVDSETDDLAGFLEGRLLVIEEKWRPAAKAFETYARNRGATRRNDALLLAAHCLLKLNDEAQWKRALGYMEDLDPGRVDAQFAGTLRSMEAYYRGTIRDALLTADPPTFAYRAPASEADAAWNWGEQDLPLALVFLDPTDQQKFFELVERPEVQQFRLVVLTTRSPDPEPIEGRPEDFDGSTARAAVEAALETTSFADRTMFEHRVATPKQLEELIERFPQVPGTPVRVSRITAGTARDTFGIGTGTTTLFITREGKPETFLFGLAPAEWRSTIRKLSKE